MKHIKFLLIIYSFSIALGENTNPILLDYFEKVYSEEINKFLSWIENEDLSKKDQIYSDCSASWSIDISRPKITWVQSCSRKRYQTQGYP